MPVTLYATFMDASKAFDVVDHDCVMNHFYDKGVRGDFWHVFIGLYTNIRSNIKWQGVLSQAIKEGQGVCQGRVSSAYIFTARVNLTLKKLEVLPGSM